MRKVICAFNISIDGCYDHTKLSGGEEILEYFTNLMKDVDQGVSGRKMYEIVNPYWREVAKANKGTANEQAFARTLTSIPSIVISRTMEEVEGGPRIIRGNLEEEIRRLKEMPGGKISIGGMSVRSQLMQAGLIDELYLVIHPAVVGSGPRWGDGINLNENIKMELVDTKIIQQGCMALHYLKR
ncbi:dihydrofolate reductase family protein [Mucilaginibacter mali]|uniref:Dihydrofolate reductase family protein n=1 Tax=Mucilaginibacter mali TaxID=2740462 RepID=A0A7D4UGK6_9SPHI|nr:dihydrofolate reductase family protein [Mucilaginibacter mali]QKJ31956.1 dihydrofolate reductase family protein [Mucilaginibacter mali]